MIVTLFRSRLRPELKGTEAHDEYRRLNSRLVELAGEMPGFVGLGTVKDRAGQPVTVVIFESEEALRAWREQPEHARAQRRGRDEWYEDYSVEVLAPVRSYSFDRERGRRERDVDPRPGP